MLAFLDKTFPPMHSFVDGMLCEAYPSGTSHRVILLVERNESYPKVCRYKGTICLNVLPRRRGLGRLKGPLVSWFYSRHLLKRAKSKGIKSAILVRNDPMFLIGNLPLRRYVSAVIFQSSFPHEVSTGVNLKTDFARFIFKKALRRTDGLLAVSEGGAKRIGTYAPGKPVCVIPLAVDNQMLQVQKAANQPGEMLNVLYLGTHDPARELNVVFEGCKAAIRNGVPMQILSVGGTPEHIEQLTHHAAIQRLVDNKDLSFIPPVPRTEVVRYLEWADVGLSLIPPTDKYLESSPTKLAEYMGAGVFCLASNGIPSQEELIKSSGSGALADFQVVAIGDALEKIWHERDEVSEAQRRGRAYVEEHFTYANYVHVLDELLWSE